MSRRGHLRPDLLGLGGSTTEYGLILRVMVNQYDLIYDLEDHTSC